MSARRRDQMTPLLPGFLQLVETAAGLAKIELRGELSVAEAARVLGCSTDTIYAMIEDGSLPARRLRDVPRSKYKVDGAAVQRRRELIAL